MIGGFGFFDFLGDYNINERYNRVELTFYLICFLNMFLFFIQVLLFFSKINKFTKFLFFTNIKKNRKVQEMYENSNNEQGIREPPSDMIKSLQIEESFALVHAPTHPQSGETRAQRYTICE